MEKTKCLFLMPLTVLIGLMSCQGALPTPAEENKMFRPFSEDPKPEQLKEAAVATAANDTIPHQENRRKTAEERFIDARDSILRNHADRHGYPKDSIDKWNAQALAERKKHTLVPDKNTKKFTIDPETGEVHGCPYIRFGGILGDAYWKETKWKNDSLRARFDAIKPRIRPVIMEGKDGELWHGDPKNVEIAGTPEAVHSGIGPIGFLFTDDNQYLIVPVGYPHGGTMLEIFFFDTAGTLLSKTVLDKQLNDPSVGFNAEQTFVIVSDGVSGDFYFFRPNGELYKKGNFNEMTGDRGTSYSRPFISESGKYWVLNNNLKWVFDRSGNPLFKMNLSVTEVDENMKMALCVEYINIMRKEVKLNILNLENGKLLYCSNIFQSKNFRYEIEK